MEVFYNDDQGFLDWMDKNPNGLVLNVPPSRKMNDFLLHRSGCGHIANKKGMEEDNFTKKLKVCSVYWEDLQDWLKSNVKGYSGTVRECKSCIPMRNLIKRPTINPYPETIPETEAETLFEGAKKVIVVNAYERNPAARKACLDYYGYDCKVCEFDFEKTFGSIGRGFIHVHHIVPLAKIGKEYQINPLTDLRPVCPNCHSMLHQRNPPFTIEELKEILSINRV